MRVSVPGVTPGLGVARWGLTGINIPGSPGINIPGSSPRALQPRKHSGLGKLRNNEEEEDEEEG